MIIFIIILVLIIICFIISYFIFKLALGRLSKKDVVLNNELNGKSTEGVQIDEPDIKWLDNHCKQVSITNKDNLKLYGYIVNKKDSKKWIILVHGYSSDHTSLINKGITFYKRGFNILLIDLQGHGKSEGKYITMGAKDCYDVKQWIKYIVNKEKANEVGLFGISMGAATVMMTSNLDLNREVKFIIEDCGYTSIWDELKYQLNNLFHLPSFPFLYICELYAKIFIGIDFKSISPIKALSKTTIPILFIHGNNDTFVPYKMLDKNYLTCISKKEKLVIDKANHTEAEALSYKEYWKTIDNFIKGIERKK